MIRSLLVAVCLLTSAATAYADCAWVLWSGEGMGPQTVWSIGPSFESRDKCAAEAASIVATYVKSGDQRVGEYIIVRAGRLTRVFQVECYPDTVDPRGPKK